MRMRVAYAAAIAAVVLAPPAWADDVKICRDASGDEAIAACTRVIQNRKTPQKTLAYAYNDRGYEYHQKRDYKRAIADFSEAIKRDPKYALAYTNRGSSYLNLGDVDRSIADHTEAIRFNPQPTTGINDSSMAGQLSAYANRGFAYLAKGDLGRSVADLDEAIKRTPKFASAYRNRGIAHFYSGAMPKALADFNQATEMEPKNRYFALWLDIVNKRNNLASRLPQSLSEFDMTEWPAPVIRLYMSQMTPEGVLSAADHPDETTRRARICEANFYLGALALQQDVKDDAVRRFKIAAADCSKNSTEWVGAVAELKRLGASP